MSKQPDTVDKIVGRNIRICRLAKGLSQTELGDQVGVTFQQIQKYENGVNRVGCGRLFEISVALGVSIPDLFEGANLPPSPKRSGRSPFDLLEDSLSVRLAVAFSGLTGRRTRHSLVTLVESMSNYNKS